MLQTLPNTLPHFAPFHARNGAKRYMQSAGMPYHSAPFTGPRVHGNQETPASGKNTGSEQGAEKAKKYIYLKNIPAVLVKINHLQRPYSIENK